RPFQSMFDLNLLAAQPTHELHIVVARDAKCRSGGDHIPDDADAIQYLRSTIHQIAEEDCPPPGRVPPALGAPRRVSIRQSESLPPGLFEQRSEFIGAPVQVADDIERPGLVLLVVPKGYAPDFDG